MWETGYRKLMGRKTKETIRTTNTGRKTVWSMQQQETSSMGHAILEAGMPPFF